MKGGVGKEKKEFTIWGGWRKEGVRQTGGKRTARKRTNLLVHDGEHPYANPRLEDKVRLRQRHQGK